MLRYIVSYLREQAIASNWRYISATICDGLNNHKEKKTPLVEKKKGCARKAVQTQILFINLRIRE